MVHHISKEPSTPCSKDYALLITADRLEMEGSIHLCKKKKFSLSIYFVQYGDALASKPQILDYKELIYDPPHYALVTFEFLGLHTRSDPHKELNIQKNDSMTARRQWQDKAHSLLHAEAPPLLQGLHTQKGKKNIISYQVFKFIIV